MEGGGGAGAQLTNQVESLAGEGMDFKKYISATNEHE
jgi:hypothetical protein